MRETDRSEIDAIRTLCSLIADGIRRVRGDAVPGPVLRHLMTWRAVVETGSVPTIWCNECDTGHLAEVVQDPAGSSLGWTCPEFGFVPASACKLRAFEVKPNAIAQSLAQSFTDPRSFDPLTHCDGIWRLGQRPLERGRTEVLMMSRLNTRRDMDGLRIVITDLPPAIARIVLVAADSVQTLEPIAGWRALPLIDLLDVQTGQLRINAAEFDARIETLLHRFPAVAGRTSKKEKSWHAIEWLRSRSLLEDGRNTRVRQLEHHWQEIFEGDTAPPRSTLEKHVTDYQKMNSEGSV